MEEHADYVSIFDEMALNEEVRDSKFFYLEKDIDVYKRRDLAI